MNFMMASLKIMLVSIAVLGISISNTLATDYVVGDEAGWKLNFDYHEWANDKEFWVGDRVIFNYAKDYHNVVKVNSKDNFQACVVPIHAEVLGTGHDIIELKTPGTKMYICGVRNHCDGGMKLAINVWPQQTESPAPAPTSGGSC